MVNKNTKVINLKLGVEYNYQEKVKDKYVTFGRDNKYDKFLIEMKQKSATHQGIIDYKVKSIIDGGLILGENKQFDILYEKILQKDANFLQNITNDLEIIGGFYVGIIYKGKEIYNLDYIPFDMARLSPKIEGKILYSCVSDNNFKNYDIFPIFTGRKQSDYEILPIFTNNQYSIYPTTQYSAALNYINSDYEIAKFHLNNIKNSFQPGAMIVFTEGANISDEQKDAIVEDIETMKGSSGAGVYIVHFVDDSSKVPVITQVPVNDLDKQFAILSETITNQIVIAHQIPRILANVQVAGSLGDGNEMISAKSNFYSSYVRYQQDIISNMFMKLVGYKPNFKHNLDINHDIISKYKEYFTFEEVRQFLGLPTINK